jgi:CDP-glycerol glycerophosphotransferase
MTINSRIIGFLDTCDGMIARGWAVDLNAPGESLLIEIICDGLSLGYGTTGDYRPDLEAINPASKNCGFTITLNLSVLNQYPARITSREKHSLTTLEGEIILNTNVEINSDDLTSSLELGRTAFESHQWKEAELHLKKTLGDGNRTPGIFWLLAQTISNLGRTWEALKYYEEAHREDPKNLEWCYALGKAYERMDRPEKAANLYSDAIKIDDKHQESYYGLGLNLRKCGRNKEAEVAYNSCIRLDSNKAAQRFGIGALHAKKGNWQEAVVEYRRQVLNKKSDDPVLFYRLGMAYEKTYDWDNAIRYYTEALERDSTDYYWHYRLGLCYERIQNHKYAANFFDHAVQRNEKFEPWLTTKLAESRLKSGDLSGSNAAFMQAGLLSKTYGMEDNKDRQNEGFRIASDYTEMLNGLSIDEQSILYESYHGASISCNPLALFRDLIQHAHYQSWRHVWVINERSRIPAELRANKNIVFIKKESDLYRFYLATCKYLINNSTFPTYFCRRAEQIYLNTWHGTPQKALFKDIRNGRIAHKNIARNLLHATHLLVPNEHTERVLLEGNDVVETFPGQVIRMGYPRVDLMLNASENTKNLIRTTLNLNSNAPVVLFAPTYREEQTEADLQKLKSDIEALYSNGYHLLFRGHYFVEGQLSKMKIRANVVPQEIDTCELLSIVDLLITDYSSIYFDYLPQLKPIAFYVPDYKEYKSERGLYIPKEELPGPCFEQIKDVQLHIERQLTKKKPTLHANHKISLKRFCSHDLGQSTNFVIDKVFGCNPHDTRSQNQKKKNLLFFAGGFIPNGITSSFINLIHSIDRDKYAITVAIDPGVVFPERERVEQLNRISDLVSIIGRCGRMNVTIEEKWIASKLTGSVLQEAQGMLAPHMASYSREFSRCFGYAKFDSVINFEGYSQFWSSLFAFGPKTASVKKSIYLHSNMYDEMTVRFPNLKGIIATYKYYDSLISVSDNVNAENLHSLHKLFNIHPTKFRRVQNTLLPDEIRQKANTNARENILPWDIEKHYTFMTMGRLSPEKDHEKLIKAFSAVHASNPLTRLVIVGQGPLRAQLEATVAALKLGSAVFFAGQQYNPFPYLSRASCFVLSSNHEGQGMVLLEALTLGKPVLSTDVSGPRSVLNGGLGLLVENSSTGLTKGMNEIMQGHLTFKNFDPDVYAAESMNQFYDEV